MAGFLQGLGEFAGGVSKGISQEAEDRARRAQARNAELEYEQKTAEDQRQAALATRFAGAPVVGQTKIGLGDVDYLLKQNTPPPPTQEDKGLIGKLAGLLSRKNTGDLAVTSGVTPQPMLGVVTPPAAGGASAPAAPMPAAPTVGVTAPPEPATPSTVALAGSAGTLTRPANEIDRQLYLAKAYAEARQFDKSEEAYKKHGQLVIANHLDQVDNASPAEMSNVISEAAKGNYRVTQNKENPDLYSLSELTQDKDGKFVESPILTDVSKGELKGHYAAYLNMDPDARETLIRTSRDQRIEAMKARSEIAKNEAVIKHYAASTANVEETTLGAAQARKHTAAVQSDLDFGKQQGSAILDPARMAALANDPTYNVPLKVTDPVTGAVSTKIVNVMRDKMEREQADYQTNKWSAPERQIVRRVNDASGNGFAVIGPDGQYLRDPGKTTPRIYDTPADAYNRAQGAYGDDADAALKTIKAAQAKTAGKAPVAAGAKAAPGLPVAKAAPVAPALPTPSRHDQDVAFVQQETARNAREGSSIAQHVMLERAKNRLKADAAGAPPPERRRTVR